jgi:hypothetical protein
VTTLLTALTEALAWVRAHRQTTQVLLALALWYLCPEALLGVPLVFGVIQLDDINTVTTKEIQPGVVDNYFKAGPIMAMARSRFSRKWVGPQIQENYLYAAMKGGAYAKGASFDVTRRQTRSGLLFSPRY